MADSVLRWGMNIVLLTDFGPKHNTVDTTFRQATLPEGHMTHVAGHLYDIISEIGPNTFISIEENCILAMSMRRNKLIN